RLRNVAPAGRGRVRTGRELAKREQPVHSRSRNTTEGAADTPQGAPRAPRWAVHGWIGRDQDQSTIGEVDRRATRHERKLSSFGRRKPNYQRSPGATQAFDNCWRRRTQG